MDFWVKMATSLATKSLLLRSLAKRSGSFAKMNIHTTTRILGGHGAPPFGDNLPLKVDIGKREIVGFGINGEENYMDDVHYPYPAIRWQEETQEIKSLIEKEKGDWKKMTVEEKKALYRYSYCQTFAEMEATAGEWKGIFGIAIFMIGVGIWGYILLVHFIYDPLPDTITDETKLRASLQRMIDIRPNPIEGPLKDYDYKKNEWKK